MIEKIVKMLNRMNKEQIKRVLEYTENEFDEENSEEHLARYLVLEAKETALLELQIALQSQNDISLETINAIKEESNRIISKERIICGEVCKNVC